MKAAVLTIGDELTSGYRLDTNSQVISRQLMGIAVEVTVHMSVGDTRAAMELGLRTVLAQADVAIVTGGLGPTEDDLTRQVIAEHYGLPLVEDDEALARMQERFARRGRAMPESNRIQAQVPTGSLVIQNDRGTAAGFYLVADGKHIFVAPGIPHEMEGMLETFILPRLRALAGNERHVCQAFLKVYGLPESEINERIRPLLGRERNPLLGLLPTRGTITVEVTAAGTTLEEADRLVADDVAALRAELGHYIISEDERELPQVLADLLVERGLTVSVAEISTGGLLIARLTEPEGSERWFRGGQVFGAGGAGPLALEEQAMALARSIRLSDGANIGVGVGPIEMAADALPGRPCGVCHLGLCGLGRELSQRLSFMGERARVREWAADAALAQVRLLVLGIGA